MTELAKLASDVFDNGKPTVESIQDEILRRICFLHYPPGMQLKEAELAAEFGVSRTPVRDAISRIKHLGLVETRNGVGTVVIEISKQQVEHVYEMRLQLAPLIGTASPREITEADLDRAAALLAEAKALEADFDARRYVELNHILQSLIIDLIGNELLRSFWRQAYFQAASTWYRMAAEAGGETATALVLELQELSEAMRQNDLAAVGLVQRVHIGYGYRRILRFMQPDTGWSDPDDV